MVERNLNPLDNLEEEFSEQHTSSGYQTGFDLGKKAGKEEGLSRGSIAGAKTGSEVGFYKGFTMTWIQLLETHSNDKTKSAKILNTLNEILELVEAFPKTNEMCYEEKLSKIRTKFKQSTSLLDINTSEVGFPLT